MAKLNGVKTLDMKDGKITKIEYGGEIYSEVIEGEPQAGDIAQLLPGQVVIGAEDYAFYFAVEKGGKVLMDTIHYGNLPYVYGRGFALLFRKTNAKKAPTLESLDARVTALECGAKPEPLKIGDYAKVVDEFYGHGFYDGDIVELTAEGHDPNFQAKRVSDGKVWYVDSSEVEKATDAEVAEAKRQQAEQTEFKRWAAIGRKPNEFKKGDIVVGKGRNRPDVLMGFIVDLPKTDGWGYGITTYTEGYRSVDITELIVPVEQRFDRERP